MNKPGAHDFMGMTALFQEPGATCQAPCYLLDTPQVDTGHGGEGQRRGMRHPNDKVRVTPHSGQVIPA